MLPLAYLASPYSHPDPEVRQQRYEAVCEAAKKLALQDNYAIYSPIMHWHPITIKLGMPTDAKFWQAQNEGVINAASVLMVLTIPGWVSSMGVDMEIQFARNNNKTIIYINPESL